MENNLATKICLGSAQFGLDYGIANERGQVSESEVFKILAFAHQEGVRTIDTAYAYGNSEEVIGKFLAKEKINFKVVSKLPALEDCQGQDVEEIFNKSLRRLKQDKLYGYLLHSFKDFVKQPKIYNDLEVLKEKGKLEKIGFSLYLLEELESLFQKKVRFDIIQVPYSVFDRRFEAYFETLQSKGVEVYLRSVFLQGLPFMSAKKLPSHFQSARESLTKLKQLSQESGVGVDALCLDFVLLNPSPDKVVIGIDSLGHLEKNINNLRLIKKVDSVKDKLEELKINDENILLPYNWPKK